MKFYFIYSAGGGAGDWKGVNRVWSEFMPNNLKSRLLLKFGDVFFEHATGNNFIRPKRWENITNLREWLEDKVDDNFVTSNQCNIMLDSGTAKAVNQIANHNPSANCDELIDIFKRIFEEKKIIEKYISVVCESEINSAVTFDIPNPFKIRSQSENAKLNIFNNDSNNRMIELSAYYSNEIYKGIRREKGENYANSVLMTIINGTWSLSEIELFLSKLCYKPHKIAIGALSSSTISYKKIGRYLDNLKQFKFNDAEQLHFLGCGGIKKAIAIKENGYYGDNVSVDCSTFINRSIDGKVTGKTQSAYYDYYSKEYIRIKPNTKKDILKLHSTVANSFFTVEEMEDIIDAIIRHQSNNSSDETYDARAKLMFHNADVFRANIEVPF